MFHPQYAASYSPQKSRIIICLPDYLITDEKELCQAAFDRGSLTKLSNLVKSITPAEKASDWDEDEPESMSRLREVLSVCL